MTLRFASVVVGLALLAGCGAPPPDRPAADNQADAPAEVAAKADSGNGAGGESAGGEPVPEVNAAEAPQLLAEIPTGFRGRWDASQEACGRPTSEMRLVVSAASLRFYESVGQVTAVRQDGEDVAVDLRTTGEGETRTETRTLSMTSDGRLEVESGGTSATRVRCPA